MQGYINTVHENNQLFILTLKINLLIGKFRELVLVLYYGAFY